jgi:anti-sigma factor RsiW
MIANCRTTVELMAAFVDGALTDDEEQALRAHLAECPRCIEFLESYRGTSRVIRDATDIALPPDVEERLLDFLATRRS